MLETSCDDEAESLLHVLLTYDETSQVELSERGNASCFLLATQHLLRVPGRVEADRRAVAAGIVAMVASGCTGSRKAGRA